MPSKEEVRINISNKLKSFRKANGLTQRDMAKALNIVESTYRSWETRCAPGSDSIFSISKMLGISVEELMSCDGYDFQISCDNSGIDDKYLSELSVDEKIFVLKYRQLNTNDKIKLDTYIKEIMDLSNND